VRKVLLLVGLAMMAVLVFAPAALAQKQPGEPLGPNDRPCPFDLNEYPEGTTCGEGGAYIDPDDPSTFASASPSASASPGINTIAESCDDQPDPAGCRRQLRGAEGAGSSATPTATATASPAASATASASASASASATAMADDSELPDTGGVATPLALAALALLVGGGMFAAFAVRR